MSNSFIHYLIIFFGSMIPLTEQRGSIPVGILVFHLSPIPTFLVCLVGSAVPVPFILILLDKLLELMRKSKFSILNKISIFVDNKLRKGASKIKNVESIALATFVAIPLPGTGLWTGAGIAVLLGLDKRKSFFYIVLGGIVSALIITLICVYAPNFAHSFFSTKK